MIYSPRNLQVKWHIPFGDANCSMFLKIFEALRKGGTSKNISFPALYVSIEINNNFFFHFLGHTQVRLTNYATEN